MQMHEFIQQIYVRKRRATYIIIGIVVIISGSFFYLTASETWNYGIEKLGEERYSARMRDSYLISLFLLLMAVPFILALNPFFNRYIEEIQKLSISEMSELTTQNKTAPFFNRYLPGYIIKDKSVLFFKFLRTSEIAYAEIINVNVSVTRGGYHLHIKTKSSFFIGLMSENIENLRYLTNYIKQANPKAIINI